jgi:hypothetical protein
VKNGKGLFAEPNEFVRARNGWITSIPGAPEVTMECLPGSMLPDELRRGLGYNVDPDGEGDDHRNARGDLSVERFTTLR